MHVISQHLALTVWAVKCVTFLPCKHNKRPKERCPKYNFAGCVDGRLTAFPLFLAD